MNTVKFCNSNNNLAIDSFDQGNKDIDLSKSLTRAENNQTITQKAISLAYQTMMIPVNTGISFLKGVAISAGFEGITSQGKSFKTLHTAFFNPKCQMVAKLLGAHSSNLEMAFNIVVVGPIIKEVFFRCLLQDIILKQGIKKTVKLASPKHVHLINSKAYTAARILLTSAFCTYCFTKSMNDFFEGILFGLLKEKYGLANAIGAHMFPRFVSMAPDIFSSC